MSSSIPKDERAVLEQLCEIMRAYGSANSAEDHVGREVARGLLDEADRRLAGVLDAHAWLAGCHPDLVKKIRTSPRLSWGTALDELLSLLGELAEQ